ncbi:MAG: BlaI/MecI/CopY family transcriptional regulator [Solirubrobacterales bacterium]|nr:BlaI/MecI/CopY family transcriptional regulator [Solirubrobacterales bacterium]
MSTHAQIESSAPAVSTAQSQTAQRGEGPAALAAERVDRAGALVGALALGGSLFALLRLTQIWRVTPAAASRRISLFGHELTYPAANAAAAVVVALALLGLAVIVMTIVGVLRELAAFRRLHRRLSALDVRTFEDVLVIDDERPRAFCAGLLRPRVYVSSGAVALLDERALRAVLTHERRHARRRDPLRLATGRVIARVLFFVPRLDELSARQRTLMELSADEAAIAAAPGNRPALARAMLAFSEQSRPEAPAGIDPARVDHLLGEPPSWAFPLILFALAVSMLGLLAAVAALAGRVASGSASLAPPFLSRQPCVAVLAAIPALLGLGVLGLRRRLGARLSSDSMARARLPKVPPALHELEAEIMEEVWRREGTTTVKLIMDALNRKAKPPRAYTTYMTVMRRLDDKGLLKRRRSGRYDTYEPTLTREEYRERRAGAEVRGLVDQFGDVALAHFARSLSTLDPAQQRRLRRLASEK